MYKQHDNDNLFIKNLPINLVSGFLTAPLTQTEKERSSRYLPVSVPGTKWSGPMNMTSAKSEERMLKKSVHVRNKKIAVSLTIGRFHL